MAVPTVAHVDPSQGPTASDIAVEILGLNFLPATIPAAPAQSDGRLHQTAVVLFDGVAATDVRVFSTGLITAIPPKHAVGKVAVTVRNLDQDTQEPIAGEEHTLVDGYEYVLPINTREAEGDFAHMVRLLIQLFKVQLLGVDSLGNERGDVTYAVQTDYVENDDEAIELHITKFARLPGLSLVGPELRENRFYSKNEEPSYENRKDDSGPTAFDPKDEAVGFVGTRVPYTVDCLFDVVVVTDNNVEFLNLMANFVALMHKNKFLPVGNTKYEFDFQPEGTPKGTTVPGNSNLRSFGAKILIRGFDIEGMSGLSIGTTAGVPNEQITERNKTVDEVVVDL